MNTLERKIMRRIYYTYALRTVAQPALLHGFFMLAMLIVLTYFVSLGSVLQNMLSVKNGGVSSLSQFVLHAVQNTEAWTLLILGVLIFSALSLRFSLSSIKHSLRFVKV